MYVFNPPLTGYPDSKVSYFAPLAFFSNGNPAIATGIDLNLAGTEADIYFLQWYVAPVPSEPESPPSEVLSPSGILPETGAETLLQKYLDIFER